MVTGTSQSLTLVTSYPRTTLAITRKGGVNMFRKILMTTVAASAMVGSAHAADLPRRAHPPAYVPPVPIFTWTGFYIGANVGGAFRPSSNDGFNDAVFFGGAAPFAAGNTNNS